MCFIKNIFENNYTKYSIRILCEYLENHPQADIRYYVKNSLTPDFCLLGYFQPNSPLQLYTDHCQIVEMISLQQPDHHFIMLGDYNLPHLTWLPLSLRISANSYIDSNVQPCAEAIRNRYSGLNLAQHFSNHPNKGYTLELEFAPPAITSTLNCQDQLISTDIHHIPGVFEVKGLLL